MEDHLRELVEAVWGKTPEDMEEVERFDRKAIYYLKCRGYLVADPVHTAMGREIERQ